MKTIIFCLIFTLIAYTNTIAAPVGSGFNYQGELTDGGSPANGNYDVLFKAFTDETDGTEYEVVPAFSPVVVTNGLFSIDNVDFGDSLYDGTEYWIEVSVRQTGTETYFPLSPRQRLNATPYAVQADFLAAGGANSGDYLKFNGNNWVGSALNIEATPWSLIGVGPNISFTTGRVGVNTTNPLAEFHVNGDIKTDGDINIGGDTLMGPRGVQATIDAKLDINSTAVGTTADPLRVRKNGDIKFYVDSNGGASVGSWDTPPADGLRVKGDTKLVGDVKQSSDSSGVMKYMVYARCQRFNNIVGGTDLEILRSYNGINSDIIEIDHGVLTGSTCSISFPTDISSRYWSVEPIGINTVGGYVGFNSFCVLRGTNSLDCYLIDYLTGEPIPSGINLYIMVMVY